MAFARPGGREEEAVFEYTPPVEIAADSGTAKKKSEQDVAGKDVDAGKPRGEYEALGSALGARAYEPPEQRLARLTAEVGDLLHLAEAQSAEDAVHGHSARDDFSGGDPAAVAAELRVLEQRLAGLARDGAESWRSQRLEAAGTRHAVAAALASQLEKLAAGEASALSFGGGSDGRVTYEIAYVPKTSVVGDSSKVASLEGQLANIERRLGVFDQGCPFSDLHTAVMQLQRRLAALDNQKLEHIRSGVHKTMNEVEAVLQKKQELEDNTDPELDRKANELYEFCHRWNAVAPVLPTIIARLQALQALHQESNSFASRLAALEQQQEELAKLLETTNTSVQDLSKNLKENVTVMRDSMKALETKITKAVQA